MEQELAELNAKFDKILVESLAPVKAPLVELVNHYLRNPQQLTPGIISQLIERLRVVAQIDDNQVFEEMISQLREFDTSISLRNLKTIVNKLGLIGGNVLNDVLEYGAGAGDIELVKQLLDADIEDVDRFLYRAIYNAPVINIEKASKIVAQFFDIKHRTSL